MISVFGLYKIFFILANAFTLAFRGSTIALALSIGGNINYLLATITFLILTVPNSLTATFTTMGRKNGRKLITNHPYILLLPAYTFFSFEKIRSGCCGHAESDPRIKFSKKMTMWNIFVNAACFGIIFVLVQVWPFDYADGRSNLTTWLLEFPLPLFVLAILFSMIFMFMEKCCGCCCLGVTCCNISDQTKVYDPDQRDFHYQDQLVRE